MSLPASRMVAAASLGSAVLGMSALAAALASLWPGLGAPPWPAGALALVALSAAWLPGRVVPKAVGTLSATCALLLVTAEIGALWGLAAAVP